MMEQILFPSYVGTWLAYTASLLAGVLRKSGLSRFLACIALVLNGAVLASVSVLSGAAPVFDLFSSTLLVTFFLGAPGAFLSPSESKRLGVREWVSIEVLLLLAITLLLPKEAPPQRYHHAHLWVLLFHGFRCLSLSSALFAAAHFLRFRLEHDRKKNHRPMFNQGRNFLLLSAVFFLCSEYAGILWCQEGWGDFWHWSATFFQSTLIILLLMAAFHIPGRSASSDDVRSVVGIMVPVAMIAVKIIKGLLV